MPERHSKSALVCGAGKIGRGFAGQLLHRSGYALYFLDAEELLVQRLREAGRYRVETAGRPELTETIPVAGAFLPRDQGELERLMSSVDLLVSSVGSKSLEATARFLGGLLQCREISLNWLLLENAPAPAESVRRALAGVPGGVPVLTAGKLGIVQTQVLRSGMLPDAEMQRREPLTLRMSDWWTLPADADAFVEPMPEIDGLLPRPRFAHEVRRKLFTFNGLNGPLAYVGRALGYRYLHEAALASELQPFVRQILEESAHGLLAEYGFDHDEHREFQQLALQKYRDPLLEDTLERNARDSARKLGQEERLVGPALLCLKHGKLPTAYARAIAAAVDYSAPEDPGTRRVQEILREGGLAAVLREICKLPAGSPLAVAVEEAWREARVG